MPEAGCASRSVAPSFCSTMRDKLAPGGLPSHNQSQDVSPLPHFLTHSTSSMTQPPGPTRNTQVQALPKRPQGAPKQLQSAAITRGTRTVYALPKLPLRGAFQHSCHQQPPHKEHAKCTPYQGSSWELPSVTKRTTSKCTAMQSLSTVPKWTTSK